MLVLKWIMTPLAYILPYIYVGKDQYNVYLFSFALDVTVLLFGHCCFRIIVDMNKRICSEQRLLLILLYLAGKQLNKGSSSTFLASQLYGSAPTNIQYTLHLCKLDCTTFLKQFIFSKLTIHFYLLHTSILNLLIN